MSLYFIAILPDEETAEQVTGFKQIIAERWGPKHAFRSPPHITLIPPFEWPDDRLPPMEQALRSFADLQSPFEVRLSGFAAFPPRVVFVHPVENPDMAHLQDALITHLSQTVGHSDTRNKRPYHPHMTIAHRDVTPDQFRDIWAYFREQPFKAKFNANGIALLKLDRDKWTALAVFPFTSLPERQA